MGSSTPSTAVVEEWRKMINSGDGQKRRNPNIIRFQHHIEFDPKFFDKSWRKLHDAIHEICNHNCIGLSFEELYRLELKIEAVATKEELEHLVMLCRSEADAMGRITAGILRLLKLDKSLGQGTIEQLRNLGSGGMDNIFSPRRLSRLNSFGSIGTPRTPTMQAIADVMSSKTTLEATISSLQGEISESKAKCMALISQASSTEDQNRAEDIRQLSEKLESMQSLVTQLKNFDLTI
ncbi:hypothetical protein ZEAMMB73_Zm00001d043896 [Zea mays]|uniref:Uncharacterized protein n=2 Tax=Zea mays TaxID=4577 RepID=A0A1D6NFY7_MAIZE|nr:hypothetical protein ZEAMMB73_Zm00001d043896 [Zea mays]